MDRFLHSVPRLYLAAFAHSLEQNTANFFPDRPPVSKVFLQTGQIFVIRRRRFRLIVPDCAARAHFTLQNLFGRPGRFSSAGLRVNCPPHCSHFSIMSDNRALSSLHLVEQNRFCFPVNSLLHCSHIRVIFPPLGLVPRSGIVSRIYLLSNINCHW